MTTLPQTVSHTPLDVALAVVLDFPLHSTCMAELPVCPACLHSESTEEGKVPQRALESEKMQFMPFVNTGNVSVVPKG